MKLPKNKTKIVCTIGPASDSPEVMEKMIRSGMDAARLNFSHGDLTGHRRVIENLRAAAHRAGRRVAIMADLPGPKIRIGQFAKEPIQLKIGEAFTLTTEPIAGNGNRVSVTFEPLLKAVKPGDTVFVNDGFIQLEVVKVDAPGESSWETGHYGHADARGTRNYRGRPEKREELRRGSGNPTR